MKRHRFKYRRIFPAALTLFAALVFSGCGILDEGDTPTKARVVIEGGGGERIQLVTSDDFVVTSDDGGETRDVFFYAADTASITPPFDEQFPLGSASRVFVQVSSEVALNEPVHMRVFLSGEERYNATSTLGEIQLEFLFAAR